MSWNYRVVRRRYEEDVERYAVHEAYYDEEGRVWAISAEPMPPRGDSFEEMSEDLERMSEAVQRVRDGEAFMLDYDEVPEPGAIDPYHKEDPS